jgi:phage-related holin
MEALYKYFSGCMAAVAAIFAPITPMVWALVGFIGFDFITGVLASRAEARKDSRAWYFESRLAWRTIEKLGFSIISLCMAFTIDLLLLGFMDLHLTNLLTGFICGVEMWSFLENASVLSDAKLFAWLRKYVKRKVEKEIGKYEDE